MLHWIKERVSARWACWRINRWLKLRRRAVAREEALRRSFLTPRQAFELLDNVIGGNLSSVGTVYVRGSSFTPGFDFGQIALVLRALADLAPALPVEDRTKIKDLVENLRGHNWGGVRRGADAAYDVLLAAGIAP